MKKSDARKKTEKKRKKHVFFPKKTRNEKNGFFHNPNRNQYRKSATLTQVGRETEWPLE